LAFSCLLLIITGPNYNTVFFSLTILLEYDFELLLLILEMFVVIMIVPLKRRNTQMDRR